MEVRIIRYGTDDYQKTLILRNEVLRKPWRRSIYDDDLRSEVDKDVIFGAFKEEDILGVGTLSHSDNKKIRIKYLAVNSKNQGKGTGTAILRAMENYARELGYKKIILETRLSVREFYLKNGYRPIGKIFISDFIPVKHINMEKRIS